MDFVPAFVFHRHNGDADDVLLGKLLVIDARIVPVDFFLCLKTRLFQVCRYVVVALVALYDFLTVFQPVVLIVIGENDGQRDNRKQKSVEIGLSVHKQVYIRAELKFVGKKAVEKESRDTRYKPYATDDCERLFQTFPKFIPFHSFPFPHSLPRPRGLLRAFSGIPQKST